MAEFNIKIKDLDNMKYMVECTPDANHVVAKFRGGQELTPAETKTLLAMGAIKKAIVEESLDAKKKESPLIL